MSTAIHTAFPLVRGKKIRVTSLDQCCSPSHPYPPNPPPPPPAVPAPPFDVQYLVTSGFVSVALTANINAGDEISVVNADGTTCVRDVPCPQFQGYGLELTFCEVQPCLFSMLTSQGVVLDKAGGQIVGLQMNSSPGNVVGEQNVCRPFALEIWTGVTGMPCTTGATAGMFGYLLLPCVQPGSVGDFTVENNAVSFTITGASTKDGANWGVGPWTPVEGTVVPPAAAGPAAQLPTALDPNTHLYLQYTHIAPPDDTNGCVNATWTPPGVAAPAP